MFITNNCRERAQLSENYYVLMSEGIGPTEQNLV